MWSDGTCYVTQDVVVNTVSTQDVARSWVALCAGVDPNVDYPWREWDAFSGDSSSDGSQPEWGSPMPEGPTNLLEMASNATHGGDTDSWTLTKLVLLAGGVGDPIATAGHDIRRGAAVRIGALDGVPEAAAGSGSRVVRVS